MIYLDNAATTFPFQEALTAYLAEANSGANPSSLHRAGFEAQKRLEGYRKEIACVLKSRAEEVYFTSGGTESANIALFGAAHALARRGKKILVSDAEHPCVAESLRALEMREGFEVVRIPTHGGKLDLDAISRAADDSVILASFMHVNNETGAVFSVADAFRLVREKSRHALCFCDCVQSFLKVPFTVETLGADLISLSAHKVHGVRGVGALWVKSGVRLVSPVCGGGQEQNLRSGTENAPGIAAFAAACRKIAEDREGYVKNLMELKETLSAGLSELGAHVLTPPKSTPHIVSASFDGYKSEVLLHLLSDAGICVSSGSACSSKKGAKSPILKAHGLSAPQADSTLRFSLSCQNTREEILSSLDLIRQILEKGRYRR